MIPTCNRPPATTLQFRAAVRHVVGNRIWLNCGHTDIPHRYTAENTSKRYVKLYANNITDKDVELIEFVLWSQGVTANTRLRGGNRVRGTCIIPPKKEKENV